MATVDELKEEEVSKNKFQQHLQLKDNVPNWFTLQLKTLQSKNITLEDWNKIVTYLQSIASDLNSVQEFLNTPADQLPSWDSIESYIGVSRKDLEEFGSYDEYLRNTYIQPLPDDYVEKDGDYVKFDMSAAKTTIKFYKSDDLFTGIEGEQTEEASLEPSKVSLFALQNNSKAALKLYSDGKLELTKQDDNFEVLNTSNVLTDDDLEAILI